MKSKSIWNGWVLAALVLFLLTVVSGSKQEVAAEVTPQVVAPVAVTATQSDPTPAPPAPAAVAPVVEEEAQTYTVSNGDALSKVFPSNWSAVCELNNLLNCSQIKQGNELRLPTGTVVLARKAVQRLADGTLPIARLGVDPYRAHRTVEKDRKILSARGYTPAEIDEYLSLRADGKCVREEFSRGTRFPWMSFGDARVLANLSAAWQKPEAGFACQLQTGRNVVIMEKCDNLTEVAPRPVVAVEAAPDAPLPPAEVALEEPSHEAPELAYAENGDIIPCDLQAGVGTYRSRVYGGKWSYAEGICWIFEDGEWQHGPGFYLNYGKGSSKVSDYANSEGGGGIQYAVQRNFLTDEGRQATLEGKIRLIYDWSQGSNPSSGFGMKQHGLKGGFYSGYTENLGNGSYRGVTFEWWKSFGQTVTSSYSGMQVQDRGSIGAYAFYEHKLTDDCQWSLRWIAGLQYTNWDAQNWLRFIPEVRYGKCNEKWLMFGPQLAEPIGVSRFNQPLHAGDIRTVGGFIRAETGFEVRRVNADQNDAAVTYTPAGDIDASETTSLSLGVAMSDAAGAKNTKEALKPPE